MFGFGGGSGFNAWTWIILILIVLQWFRVGHTGLGGVGAIPGVPGVPGIGGAPIVGEVGLMANGGLFIIAIFLLVACGCFKGAY